MAKQTKPKKSNFEKLIEELEAQPTTLRNKRALRLIKQAQKICS